MVKDRQTVALQNVNHPVQLKQADADMYNAMKVALLKVIPLKRPGLTVAETRERVLNHLPQALYPDGAKAGWWTKAVQLDLEARGLVAREKSTPIRLYKT